MSAQRLSFTKIGKRRGLLSTREAAKIMKTLMSQKMKKSNERKSLWSQWVSLVQIL